MLKEEIKKEIENTKDYKERFLFEYYALVIRYEKLKSMLENWDNLNFSPSCPKSVLQLQLTYMLNYMTVLEARAAIENIDIRR